MFDDQSRFTSHLRAETTMAFGDPSMLDLKEMLEQIQKDLADLKGKHGLFSGEHLAQVLGYASIQSELADMKEALAAITKRLDA